MSVMELLRSATSAPDDTGEPVTRPELGAAAGGAATAAAGLLLVLALALLGGLAAPRATASAGDAVGVGSQLWLGLGGARFHLADGTIALTPLLGLLGLLALARLGARRSPLGEGADDLRLLGSWLGGYLVVGLLAVALGAMSPASPVVLSLLLPLVTVPVLGLLWARGLPEVVAERLPAVPHPLRRGWLPGLQGAGALVGAGMALILIGVLIHHDRVGQVHAALGPGLGGGLLLVALQLALAPNLGIWALSFAAGPGFSTSGGAMTTWSGAESGLLPMVPVLAAQPEPGDLPWAVHLLVLVPILLGAWIARSTLRRSPRLAATSAKAGAVACAVLLAVAAVALLDLLAGGSLGAGRLADLGASTPALTLALTGELALGAALVLARDWWVLRR